MGDIKNFRDFEDAKKETKGKMNITLPTKEEIAILNAITDNYGEDEVVDIAHWNGSCWKSFFENIDNYAKDNGFDKWDTRAVILTKILGTEFIITEDKITVKTKAN